ncbi:MAG: hypothetical protein R3C39_10910 [Dehalococcoidia bacterium]
MQKESRFQQAVRAVWERSHTEYLGWSEEKRSVVRPAVDALLAWLGECIGEAELDLRYWETGDPPGALLQRHLPAGFDADEQLMLEEACFWQRLLELRRSG